MRSPQLQFILSPKRLLEGDHLKQRDNDDDSINSNYSTRSRASIPQPRASFSSFAAPAWNNGTVGEHNSNVRVVARIRPMTHEEGKATVFAISNDVTDKENFENFSTMKSPPPGSSDSKGVADIAAQFNANTTSIDPKPAMITTPTKFINKSNRSPTRIPSIVGSGFKTPIHTNVDNSQQGKKNYKNNIVPSSSLRQSFMQLPSSTSTPPSTSVKCGITKRSTLQTISAGLTDPKHFDFDAVSNHFKNSRVLAILTEILNILK